MEYEITVTEGLKGFYATCRGKYAFSPISPTVAAALVASRVFGSDNIDIERLATVDGVTRFRAQAQSAFTIAPISEQTMEKRNEE